MFVGFNVDCACWFDVHAVPLQISPKRCDCREDLLPAGED